MPLHIGNTNIGAIYKGTTPISAIYKGTTLVFSSYSWQEYLYEYLYHNLVPTTINSKSVQDKAKLVEIQGNSCVVNQLLPIPTISSQTLNGITLTNNNDGTITIQGTASSDTTFTLMGNLSRNIPLGHYVMITNFANPNNTTYYFYDAYESGLTSTQFNSPNGYIKQKAGSSTTISPRINIKSGTAITTPQTIKVEYIDLTQQSPFDTPTTLTDNRVKRIIEQGYIPYNTGEIKDSVVGEISSQGYNLFDGEIELGWINSAGGLTTDTNTWRSKNYTQVVGGFEYTLSSSLSGYTNMYVYQYDKGKNLIKYSGSIGSTSIPSYNITLENETKYIKFAYYKNGANFTNNLPPLSETQLCLHRTGTRTGYADYIPQQYLPSEYQEVEYLESTGTQYIDTGVKQSDFTNGLIIKMYYQVSQTPTANESFIGAFDGGQYCLIGLNVQSGSNPSRFVWQNGTEYTRVSPYDFNKHYFELNGVDLTSTFDNQTQPLSPQVRTINYNLYIFGANDSGTLLRQSNGKLYSCKLYNNNILIRNFIPCYRKSDNVAGLYDLVNNLFYTNNGTGTFNVGKKVNNNTMIKLPAPLDLGGVNTAHNTFAITKTNYVFTRNVFDVDLGTLNWTYNSQYDIMETPTLSNMKVPLGSVVVNGMCHVAKPIASDNRATETGKIFYIYDYTSTLTFRNMGYSSASDFTTAMSGVMLKYQLATPQVINIPRKHLGVVDLGTLEWSTSPLYGAYSSDLSSLAKKPNNNNTIPNIYCSKYITSYRSAYTSSNKKLITIDQSGDIDIEDNDLNGLTNQQVQALLSGVYLFYETENEVQDLLDEMLIQSGGTVNGNQPILPLAYQEVEYIESQGAQAIDTGIYNSDDNEFEIDFQIGNASAGRNYIIGGAGNNPTDDRTQFSYSTSSFLGWGDSAGSPTLSVNTNRHLLTMDKSAFKIDGTTVYTPDNHNFTNQNKSYLFAIYYANGQTGSPRYCDQLKIYSCKIYTNGNLVRNFIPCYNRSTSEAGMFDLVTNQFFSNVGTGSFLKGRDVTNIKTCEVLPNLTLNLKSK